MEQKDENEKNEYWLKYVILPVELLGNEELNYTDMVLFAFIDLLDGEEGCYASNSYLGNIINSSEITVSKSINKLLKLQYLKIISFDGRRRIIKVNQDYKKIYAHAFKNFNIRLKGNLKADLKAKRKLNIRLKENLTMEVEK